jgi:transcription initiation factor TFIIA large subunit
MANTPTIPSSSGTYHQPMAASAQNYVPPPPQNNAPRVKTEPGLESPTTQAPFQAPVLTNPNATTAQQRAAQHLQANYGQRAAASINAIQGNVPQQSQNTQQGMQQQQQAYSQQQMAQMQGQSQSQSQATPAQRPQMTQEQYRQAIAAQMQQRMQNQGNNVGNAQTDGAGDGLEESFGVVKRGSEVMGRVEIDGLIRAKIAAMGQSMEGGGLMLPLKQASNAQSRLRQVAHQPRVGKAQNDGGDSDDEDKDGIKDEDLDEDAINSDLDDPEDGLNDEEDDDEGLGHIMLCMYDKVQRVKNKWYVFPVVPLTFQHPERALTDEYIKQEVRYEGWRPDRQRQGIRIP